jgi:DNA-binding transcriptional MerR regulator
VELKKTYSSREVAQLTGLTARQLQWWDARRVLPPAIPSRRTPAGGFTERRYTPVELLELLVLAELRRHGFTVQRIRRLLDTLKRRFGVRLFETIGGAGPVTLLTDGKEIYARTTAGEVFNVLRAPTQPLLVIGEDLPLKELTARARPSRRRRKGAATRSGTRRRGLPPDAG